MSSDDSDFIYRIDQADTIVSVSDNWSAFASANEWEGSVGPDGVVGHKLWDFIQDRETRHLYQELLRRSRAGLALQAIPFRCDSPSERRYLELVIKTLPDKQVEFVSRILRTEPREPASVLDADTPRSEDIVTICSMCKKIEMAPGRWVELEEALAELRLFEGDAMPQLSHGLCESCFEVAMGETG